MADCIDCSNCGADTEVGFCESCLDEMNADDAARVSTLESTIEALRADLAKMTPSPEVRAAIIACADVAAAALHRTSGNPYTGLVFDWLAALPPDAEKPVPCPDCADGAYPHYGGAPGSDFAGPTDADIVV